MKSIFVKKILRAMFSRNLPSRSRGGLFSSCQLHSVVLSLLVVTSLTNITFVRAQGNTIAPAHPHVFFDSTGAIALRQKVLSNPRLNKIWQRFKIEEVDSVINLQVTVEGMADQDLGREYGDALGALTVAWVVLQDTIYSNKVMQMMLDLAALPDWGSDLSAGHISLGYAFAWDVLFNLIPDSLKTLLKQGVLDHGDNHVTNDVYTNINWTPSAGEGLIGLAFQGDGDVTFDDFVAKRLSDTKFNFKEKSRNVLWGHGTDGFPHQGLGYWRKYIHIGLFLQALRNSEPQNDWFHLGKEYPGSEFLKNTGYPRIYADVQADDLATMTWADSRQVRSKPGLGPFGNIGLLTLVASVYQDGYVMDFLDYLLDETGARFNPEDWATFLFYDDAGVPAKSYRDLPLSRYWPDMEAAIFRSGWEKDAMAFYMRSGSPGGHGRFLKQLSPGGHDHPDANGFVIYYDNDYLAAEDGAFPQTGPDKGNKKITYGHNTFLIDGKGQKGDRTNKPLSTAANMDYLDAEHVGYLLGDATDAYEDISQFYRSVIYRKHKYFVMVDELADNLASHKYEYLLGTDSRHVITATAENEFVVSPQTGSAEMEVVFVEPRAATYAINRDRPYAIDKSMVDLLRVAPAADGTQATFFTLLYPRKQTAPLPEFEKLYYDSIGISGLKVDGDEYHLFNKNNVQYSLVNLTTDAKLCYFKDSFYEFEYLSSRGREFLYKNRIGFRSTEPVVAAFKQTSGKIRIGKNAGPATTTSITLFYPGLRDVLIDGQSVAATASGPGWMTFSLAPKQHLIGPSRYEQVVTENYSVEIIAAPFLRITSPNGGEIFEVGSLQPVNWTADSMFKSVRIDYSTDFSASWQSVVGSTENDGTYDWLIPDNVTASALIRVQNFDETLPVDISDAPFAIDKPPVLISFQPERAQVGAVIALFGDNLSRVNAISIGGVLAPEFSAVSDTVIQVVVPEGARSGQIAVSNRIGSDLSSAIFSVVSAPFVDSFSPVAAAVNSAVSLRGLNLFDVSRVTFNGVLSEFYVVFSDTAMQAIVPVGATTGKIAVTNPLGTGYSGSNFKVKQAPLISGFSPLKGPPGTPVEISGMDFLDVTAVSFGTVPTDSFTIKSDSILVTHVPPQAEMNPIYITNPLGKTASEEDFIVTYPAVIDAFSPRSGPVATQVRIQGAHLLGASDVSFGGVPALFFNAESNFELIATVPAGAETGKIAVTNADETTFSSAFFVVYEPVRNTIFHPAEDAHVKSSSPATNYGDKSNLKVESTLFSSYLKFLISGIDGGVRRAVLRLFVENESDQGGLIYSSSNFLLDSAEPWRESTITWENAPAILSGPVDSLHTIEVEQWVEFDVTAAVDSSATLSFAILNQSANQVAYSSGEGVYPPELIVATVQEPQFLPAIHSFSPLTATAGDEILINGTRLNEVTAVSFNGMPASEFAADSFTSLRVQVPFEAASGPISVFNYAGEVSSAARFEFVRPVVDSTFTFAPVEDAYVRSAKANGNYGSSLELQTVHSAFSETRTLLKFEINGLVGDIRSATLKFMVADGSDSGGAVFLVANNYLNQDKPWHEAELTWANAPVSQGIALDSVANPAAGSFVEFDLTNAIEGDGVYSFLIAGESADKVAYASKESVTAPMLTLITDVNSNILTVDHKNSGNALDDALPKEVILRPNYPNPFNAATRIEYALPEKVFVKLGIYNILGQTVKTLVDEVQTAGEKKIFWAGMDDAGSAVASGVYFVSLKAGDRKLSRKVLLQK